jgi:energy-coupling factor transporter ATP-binding protein EcfA2
MLHLNGILKGEGEVKVCGIPITSENIGEIRASVGLVFQDPDDQLFSPTVFEDVAFGPLYMGFSEAEVYERVEHALDAVGMLGYEGRTSHHLSGGEKKQIAIATVLSMDPEILVLDEPTAGLDPRSRRRLINLLKELPQTMLVSTHDIPMVAELFSRMIVIDKGEIVGDGDTHQLLGDKSFIENHGLELATPW